MNRSPLEVEPPGVTLRCDDVCTEKDDGDSLLVGVVFRLARVRAGVLVGVRNGDDETNVLFVRLREGRGGVFIDGYWATEGRSTMIDVKDNQMTMICTEVKEKIAITEAKLRCE